MWPGGCRQRSIGSWLQRLERVSAHLPASSASTSSFASAARIEALTTQDEGGRGIAPLVVPGDLAAAAAALARARRVGIVTGFPCLITEEGEARFDSPQETDGPPGAVAIAKALLALDAEVVILTDDVNASVVASCIGTMTTDSTYRRPELRSFPPRASLRADKWQETWREMLHPTTGFDHLVAIERAGPATDGRYYTMSKKDMTSMMAPLDDLFLFAQQSAEGRVITTAIGDGGNEVGMGKVIEAVHKHITNGVSIGCTTPTDYLVTASVSNWGGYALAAALAAEALQQQLGPATSAPHAEMVIDQMVPTPLEAKLTVQASLNAGARDGISGTAEPVLSVDGMEWPIHEEVLLKIRAAVAR